MTKPISKKPHTHASTPSTEPDTRQTPGPEIYIEMGKSLRKFQKDVLSGRWDGRPDRAMEAFRQLKDLNRQAFYTFLGLNREIRNLQARWDVKLEKSTRPKV